MDRSAIFLIHLLQDVHVLRPLIFMAARDFGFRTELLVSDRFGARDTSGVWANEIATICGDSGARAVFFASDWQARSHLNGQGLLFAAAESHVQNHAVAHDIFRHAPASFVRVTVQHGFECVGFRHGADHVRSYGKTASFAADLLCAWSDVQHLPAIAPSQVPKVVPTGPTSVLQIATAGAGARPEVGLVCENLHSVRFGKAGALEQEFLTTFRGFAGAMDQRGLQIGLRPHPGGQYAAKSKTALPKNVHLENGPLYRLNLKRFAYGISPPSSVLIDMLLADVPSAVWQDRCGRVDAANYTGLPAVSSVEDMVSFAERADRCRDELLLAQRQWLDQQGIVHDPTVVYARFATLFDMAERMDVKPPGFRMARG